MWEAILIAIIPTTVASIVAYVLGKKKNNVEIKKLEEENTTIRSQNSTIIFDMYKKELEDINKRFSTYIEEANSRAKINKEKIEKLEASNTAKDKKIQELTKKVDAFINEVCLTKGCSKRIFLKENDSSEGNKH